MFTLGLGIGGATVVFSAADHVFLRPLPYRGADRVVTLWETDRETGETRRPVSPGNFLDWRERSRSFSAMALAEPYGYDLTGEPPPESVEAWIVSEGFLEALGVTPIVGRGFRPEDFRRNAGQVVLVSYGFWQRRYGTDASVVGRTIELGGRPATVIGVLPPWLEYPEAKELWAPKRFRAREPDDRTSAYMYAVARLRPGTSLAAAEAELRAIAAALADEHPRANGQNGVNVVPLEQQVLGEVRPALLVLLGASALLLLIACTNVANLFLARGAEREHELGLRRALGARGGRLVQGLVAESGLIAALGGAVGLGMAYFGIKLLVALSPPELPRIDAIALDARVLVFAVLVTTFTVLLFGLAPALQLSRLSPLAALQGSRTTAGSRVRARVRRSLIVAEISLALILLIGAGLLVRSFDRLLANDPGFRAENRVALQLFLWGRAPTPEQRVQRIATIEQRLEALPGVEAVGTASALPFHPHRIAREVDVAVEGRPMPPSGQTVKVDASVASADYFRVTGIPLVAGRSFSPRDGAGSPPVVLVNEALAGRLFPDEDPIGRRVVMGASDVREIVGVVGNVRPTTLASAPQPELYVPLAQSSATSVTFVARTRGEPAAVIPFMRDQVWQIDPEQPIYHAATLEQLMSRTLVERRFYLALLLAFSVTALVLAAVGTYGLISYTVSQRSREMGIRIALGARGGQVVGGVVRYGVGLGFIGALFGLGVAVLLTRAMEQMLYGIEPTDPATFLGAGALLLAVVALSAYVPARRATRMDPMAVLKTE